MNLGYLPWTLLMTNPSWADRLAVRDDRVEFTYRQLDVRIEAFAQQLRQRGFTSGDVLAVMLPNRVELLIAMFAAWRLGGAATPVNPGFTADEAGYQISDSGAVLVVNGGPDAPTGAVDAIHVADMQTELTVWRMPAAELSADELALLIYTSGSTGRPKGVMLDHANTEAMCGAMAEHLQLTSDDHCLLVLPLFHVNAIMVSALATLRSGGQLSIVGQFSASRFFDQLEQLRPTNFSAVPTIYALLASVPEHIQPDTSSLRFVICGAAPVSAELLQRCEERFGFTMVEGYGLTEGTCASACNPIDGVRKLGTLGPPLPGQRIAIRGADGAFLPAGEVGEVLISGPTVMRGYLNNPHASSETVVDGWLHTGDVGRLDDDGYLTIVDRVKDMIIRGGENIYPKEIESVLASADGVLESAVVGRPDEILGEVPIAYVSVYPDAAISEQQLLEHCRQHLTRVKVPERIHLVETLPKNRVGKIDKPTLRRSLQAQPV